MKSAALALAGAFAACALADPLPAPPPPAEQVKFTPPEPDAIPDTPFGAMVRLGRDVFVDTQRYAKPYVGNGLNCSDCHLDAGRLAGSAPMWAAYVAFPAFFPKDNQVDTFGRRVEDCFLFSMNGRTPPLDSAVITGLIAYSHWMATGAPVGAYLAGRGYPPIADAPQPPSAARGRAVYTAHCAACHQAGGGGLKQDGRYAFPPVWGSESYNAGAGMARVPTAAAFIKANMPAGQGGTLSDQDAWDVAAYVNGEPRPPDPSLQSRSSK
ncbi:MAG TPA: c-type cytochrome [Casimicrobiaceae bacterium]|nr:c-type cytochrome [Casimicrobiaceae bacterium]